MHLNLVVLRSNFDIDRSSLLIGVHWLTCSLSCNYSSTITLTSNDAISFLHSLQSFFSNAFCFNHSMFSVGLLPPNIAHLYLSFNASFFRYFSQFAFLRRFHFSALIKILSRFCLFFLSS